jgi:hypothetical protein
MRIDSAGNVGIGCVPQAFYSTFDSLRIGDTGGLYNRNDTNVTYVAQNMYIESSGSANPTYIENDEASWYLQSAGQHQFHVVASGTGTISSTQAMTILVDGNVGIGDTDPSEARLSVYTNTAGDSVLKVSSGSTVDDHAVEILHEGNNTTQELGSALYIDNNGDNAFGLSIENSGSNTSAIYAYTNVGSGVDRPVVQIHADNLAFDQQCVRITNDGVDWTLKLEAGHTSTPNGMPIHYTQAAPDNTGYQFLYLQDNSTARMQVQSNGNVQNHDNSFGAISDERIKQDIRDANSQWDDIKAIRVRNFTRKDDVAQYGENAWEQIGVVAQEVELVSPKLVSENQPSDFELEHCGFGKQVDGKWVPKQVGGKDVTVKQMNYSILYMKAIKALQETMTKIETLETKVKALEDA